MPFVRQRLGVLRLKRIPELHVKEDDSATRGTRVLQILDELEQGGEGSVPRAAGDAADADRRHPRCVPVPAPRPRRSPSPARGGRRNDDAGSDATSG